MAAATSQSDQLTAPPGWTKKLVPAKSKNITLRKHDVVFISPDGQEVPSQWHLRRYLKAHPGGPGFSDFDWSSGEESVRRSGRASTKEVSYSEKITRGKRNASEMDAGGAEEGKLKTPVRKQAKNVVESDERKVLPNEEEAMNDVIEGEAVGGDGVVGQAAAEPATVVHIDKMDVSTGKNAESAIENQLPLVEDSMNVTDAAIQEKSNTEAAMQEEVMMSQVATLDKPIVKEVVEQVAIATNGLTHEKASIVEEVIEQVINSPDVVMHVKLSVQEVTEKAANLTDAPNLENSNVKEVLERVVEREGHTVEVDDLVNKVNTPPVELLQEKTESKKEIGQIGCFESINGLSGETSVVDSGELQEAFDTGLAESNKLLDQNLQVTNIVIVQQQQPVDHNIEVSGAVMVESKKQYDQNVDVEDAVIVPEKMFEQNPGLTDAFVVESEKLLVENLEDSIMAEPKKLFDKNCEVMEDVENITSEVQERQGDVKSSSEPFMQREEQERLNSANDPPLQVEHVREKSPSEIYSSSVSIFNQ